MTETSLWNSLTIITAILLVIYWNKGRNPVWGGLTLGIILGFVVDIFFVLTGKKFQWSMIGRGAILGTLAGFMAELLRKLSDFIRKGR